MVRALVASAALVVVGAHATGNVKGLIGLFDIGLEPHHILYFAALPFTCIMTYVLLIRE